jgi:hypothetical protein
MEMREPTRPAALAAAVHRMTERADDLESVLKVLMEAGATTTDLLAARSECGQRARCQREASLGDSWAQAAYRVDLALQTGIFSAI